MRHYATMHTSCEAAHHPLGFAQILAARGQIAAIPGGEWRKKNCWNFPVS